MLACPTKFYDRPGKPPIGFAIRTALNIACETASAAATPTASTLAFN